MGDSTIPILFDTDIGNDIDDAVALSYLLRQPRCELLGVTTVSGDTNQRAALAETLCRAAGRDNIPIHAGLTGPILHGRGQPEAPQYAAIRHLPHRTDYPNGAAIDFLRKTIRTRPGEITLLAVGPFTNLGALFACDPELPSLLKEIVVMGGVFTAAAGHGPGAREWNALIDPIATALLFRHGAGRLRAVGLDVTEKCRLDRDRCRERFRRAGEPLTSTLALAEVWFEHQARITFHDPLAAALIFSPELCEWQAGEVTVESGAGALEGLTCWRAVESGPHKIAVSVRADDFFEHYFGITGG